ncbi:MAG: STAS-like domain-containing protein [Chloroflexi bacterium]|nr:STAS-like domain-containing protein [Chloroflexota bacterium]
MSEVINVYGLLGTRALVTREAAQRLGPAIAASLARKADQVALDFSQTLGITPSFLDELLRVVQDSLRDSGIMQVRLKLKNPPTRLSLKFMALARGRGVRLAEADGDTWLIAVESPTG